MDSERVPPQETEPPDYRTLRRWCLSRPGIIRPSHLQSAFRVTWNRACSLLEELEADRVLLPLRPGEWSPAPRHPQHQDDLRPAPPLAAEAWTPTATRRPSPPQPFSLNPAQVTRPMIRLHLDNQHGGPILTCPLCRKRASLSGFTRNGGHDQEDVQQKDEVGSRRGGGRRGPQR